MPDGIKSNLEPVEESDMNLRDKFVGGGWPEQKIGSSSAKEQIQSIEGKVERSEGKAEKEAAYTKILAKAASSPPIIHDDVADDAKKADSEKDSENKIKNLISLAEMKGIPHAVKVARHLEDNYVLDEFHGRLLAEELHDALVKKGVIKEI